MLDTSVFGEMEKSGKIVRDVHICAYTGLTINSGDVTIPIGRGHFYRLKGPLNRRPEAKEEVEDKYREQMGISLPPERKK